MTVTHRITPDNIATYRRASQKRAIREIARNAKPATQQRKFAPIAWTVYAVTIGATLATLFAAI